MRDVVRALIGLLTLPGTSVFGGVLLANGTAGATQPSARFNTAHPPPDAAPRSTQQAPASAAAAVDRTAPGGTCFDQHELGQELRQAGRLMESRAVFAGCARPECPRAVQRDCRQWSGEVNVELPRVLFRVSVAGEPRKDARVEIDGQWRREASVESVTLDPGLHELRVSATAASPLERQLQLKPGAREQLSLNLQPLPEESPPVSALSWVLGGVGLAGTAGFVAFGLSSRSLEQDLEQRCAPLCSEEEIDRVRHRSVIANVSLGLGVTSLAAAGALYLLQGSKEQPALRVGITPLRGRGALCNVQLRAF